MNAAPADELVVADIGGTHVRFAVARMDMDVPCLDRALVLRVDEHPDLHDAWRRYRDWVGGSLPRDAAIAVAAPVNAEPLVLANNPWVIRSSRLAVELGLDRLAIVNDFGAVGHLVPALGIDAFAPVAGPRHDARSDGVTTIIGLGTGLGVALVHRAGDRITVVETEAGHAGFAPVDDLDDRIYRLARHAHGRASAERVLSGPGLGCVHQAVCEAAGVAPASFTVSELWTAAIDGTDANASAALDKLIGCLGVFAGDMALAHGASRVVLSGTLVGRIADRLATPLFATPFTAKGRFAAHMGTVAVQRLSVSEPGLVGAALAFRKVMSRR
ncbi:MAG TPA: glucokinase [Sphingomonas sp.]|jgi:glucokinase|uniref:glucokinase n=1 Tax=Sphingomonas sp. TaxID=28214 RepID=UPI002EDACD5B